MKDQKISERLSVNGKQPLLALIVDLDVDVEEVFMHCSKSFIRSRLWHPDFWPARGTAPTLAEWVVGTVYREQTVEEIQGIHTDDEEQRHY